MANAKACREKAHTAKSRGLAVACEGDGVFMLDEQDLQVERAVHTIQENAMEAVCKTFGIVTTFSRRTLVDAVGNALPPGVPRTSSTRGFISKRYQGDPPRDFLVFT